MTYCNKSGAELYKEGIRYVAKISIWESQRDLLTRLFEWSEQNNLLWEWFETIYQNDAQDKDTSSKEISFIYYLNESDKCNFMRSIPELLRHFVRIEEFDPSIYDHYQSARKGVGIAKHYPEA